MSETVYVIFVEGKEYADVLSVYSNSAAAEKEVDRVKKEYGPKYEVMALQREVLSSNQ